MTRADLDAKSKAALLKYQGEADALIAGAGLDTDAFWSARRRSQAMKRVHAGLCRMAGDHERCMYCEDSHGTDIEHFWPKVPYPERMFVWPNLLLCCAECGRFKGKEFPRDRFGQPLLIDPSAEDPWTYLDFEPRTGNLTARFDPAAVEYSNKGTETVSILHLDEREALARSHLRTFHRLQNCVTAALATGVPVPGRLVAELRALDGHGLLAWCFSDRGRTEPPFDRLYANRAVWGACCAALA